MYSTHARIFSLILLLTLQLCVFMLTRIVARCNSQVKRRPGVALHLISLPDYFQLCINEIICKRENINK
jgi:hypothetical protein